MPKTIILFASYEKETENSDTDIAIISSGFKDIIGDGVN